MRRFFTIGPITLWLLAASAGPARACMPADCNQNGRLDAADPICVVRCLVGLAGPDNDCGCSADCNCSGRLEAGDAICVVRRLIDDLPVDACQALCGDGTLDTAIEECDDGNQEDGDGCSSLCRLEDPSAVCDGLTPISGTTISSKLVAIGLDRPVAAAAPPLDPRRLYVVEQEGRIRVIRDGELLDTPFLEIETRVAGPETAGERGLLGLAFHPAFETNRRFFVNYTRAGDGATVIARYQARTSPDSADPASERVLLVIDQPDGSHNGGTIAFGPDGYLYVGLGDGGGRGDPLGAAQDSGRVLGKLLRLDVDVDAPPYHAVPATNPAAALASPLGLIWAKGLRNPWKFSFDRLTGDVYIGDVGQGSREEIDFQPAASGGGENYGWDVFEGTSCFEPRAGQESCPDPAAGFTPPIHEYTRSDGCSVTGGHVYRGCALPQLSGTYFYSDFCAGFVRTFRVLGGAITIQHADATPAFGNDLNGVVSFAEDARGELYVLTLDGNVRRMVPGT